MTRKINTMARIKIKHWVRKRKGRKCAYNTFVTMNKVKRCILDIEKKRIKADLNDKSTSELKSISNQYIEKMGEEAGNSFTMLAFKIEGILTIKYHFVTAHDFIVATIKEYIRIEADEIYHERILGPDAQMVTVTSTLMDQKKYEGNYCEEVKDQN